jgi:hypothetical protein
MRLFFVVLVILLSGCRYVVPEDAFIKTFTECYNNIPVRVFPYVGNSKETGLVRECLETALNLHTATVKAHTEEI